MRGVNNDSITFRNHITLSPYPHFHLSLLFFRPAVTLWRLGTDRRSHFILYVAWQ